MADVLTGGCLCGGVRFEVDPPFIRAGHCHCSRCRRHSGTAVCTQGRVWRSQFRLLQGADLVHNFRTVGHASKAFCSVCGSSLFGGDWPDGVQVSIRLGAVDGDPGIRPQFHTFVGSKAPWDEITDDLPQHVDAWSKDTVATRPGPAIVAIDHVQLAMPAGEEDAARAFYVYLLGLLEVEKPAALARKGGAWFESGTVKVHLGVESDFRAARKAHPAFVVRDLAALLRRLRSAGVEATEERLEGTVRAFVSDPFGNRIELRATR